MKTRKRLDFLNMKRCRIPKVGTSVTERTNATLIDNRDLKIQRRGRQREHQKNNSFHKQNNNFVYVSRPFVFARLRRENA